MVRVDREVHCAIQLLVGANIAKGLPLRKGVARRDLQGCYRHITPPCPTPRPSCLWHLHSAPAHAVTAARTVVAHLHWLATVGMHQCGLVMHVTCAPDRQGS